MKQFKHVQMANYLSAIKTTFLIYGLHVACFAGAGLKYYQTINYLTVTLSYFWVTFILCPLVGLVTVIELFINCL